MLSRRGFFVAGLAPLTAFAAPERLRGRLISGQRPRLELDPGSETPLAGDRQTTLVLGDRRLNGEQLEVSGQRLADGRFEIGPIHTRSLYVLRGEKKLFVTYWCEVCAIRTYAPGICACCQDETALDLRDTLAP